MEIVKMKSIREQVYEKLKELIINGEIEPGQKIVELEYAKKFDVSRTPIREALRMLELEGFVDTSGKGGVEVKFISEVDIKEVYKIRIALENLVIEEIISKKKINLKKLERNIAHTQKIIDKTENTDQIIKLFSEFNKELYEISDLTHVAKLVNNINEYIKRFRRLCLVDYERVLSAYNDHLEILEAIKNKDIEKAKLINERHLYSSMNYVLNKIRK